MVKLRLRRKGRIHNPVYDVVAVDIRRKRDGKYLERLGYYDPNQKPSTIKIDANSAIKWLNNGAQPTDRVRLLLSYEGILLRRTMEFKGKSEEEIAEAVEKHKMNAASRYEKQLEARKARKAKQKEAPEEEAPAEETAEAPTEEVAEAPAEETAEAPAEEASEEKAE